MKRFVLKFLLFVVPVILLFLAFNALYERTNYWKSKNYANKYTDAPYDLELGNIGSSIPCFALKYDVVPGIKAWNFANVTETYFWSYRVLKNYINHFKEGAVVLVEIPYFGINSRMETFRERYYRILPKKDMDKWIFSEWLAYKKFPLLSSGRFKTAIFHDIKTEEMSCFYDRDGFMSEEEFKTFAKSVHDNYNNMCPQDGYEENYEEVCDIINLCYDSKIVPVLVSYPMLDVMNEFYENEEGFFESYYRFINGLQSKYPGLAHLDYSRDSNFVNTPIYFKDAVHMNNRGAEAFTRTIVSDLRKRGLLR